MTMAPAPEVQAPYGYVAVPKYDQWGDQAGWDYVRDPSVATHSTSANSSTSTSSSTSINLTPQMQVGRDGQLYIFDPSTKTATVVPGSGALSPADAQQYATQWNIAQLQAATQRANTQTTEEGANARSNAQIAANANEGALTREQQAQLDAIHNALNASQFGATYGLDTAKFQQQQQTDALNAAKQFADLISSTDTAALPAFYKAGGGVIANALAGHNSALSDNALLPAARTLEAIARPVNAPGAYNPFTYDASQFGAPQAGVSAQGGAATGGGGGGRPGYAGTPYENPNRGLGTAQTITGNGQLMDYTPGQTAPQPISAMSAPGTNAATQNAAMDAAGVPSWVTRFAYGTGPISRTMPRYATGSFIAGDSTDPNNPAAGGAHPEEIDLHSGPNGQPQASVTPLVPPGTGDGGDNDGSIGDLLIALGKFLEANDKDAGPVMGPMAAMMPRDAYGTLPRYDMGTDPSSPIVAPEDQPFLDQVRQLRQQTNTAPPISGGYFNVGYGNVAPTLRSSYLSSLQTAYGVPTGDIQAEANRYALQGVDPNAFTSGYGGNAKQDI